MEQESVGFPRNPEGSGCIEPMLCNQRSSQSIEHQYVMSGGISMQINAAYEGLKEGKLIFFITQGTFFPSHLHFLLLSQAYKTLEGAQHPQCGSGVL